MNVTKLPGERGRGYLTSIKNDNTDDNTDKPGEKVHYINKTNDNTDDGTDDDKSRKSTKGKGDQCVLDLAKRGNPGGRRHSLFPR